MPLIFVGIVLLLLIAVFGPYAIAIAAAFIVVDRWIVAFFISLIPFGLLVVSIATVYVGFQDVRREFRKPRRRVGHDDGEEM